MGMPLLMVDFVAGGHHALYIRHLVHFGLNGDRRSFTFLIPRELRDRVLTQLSPSEAGLFLQHVRILENDRTWRRIRRWIRRDNLARCFYVEYLNFVEGRTCTIFILFLETVFYQVAFSPLPRFNVSGLMFRPTFYYSRKGMLVGGTRSRAVFLIKWAAAYACAKRPGISRVLTLDPLAQEHAHSRWNCHKFQVIPDPFGPAEGMPRPVGTISGEPRRSLTLLIAGVLSARKGIREVVRGLLYSSEDIRRRVILVVVGEMDKCDSGYVSENLRQLEESGGNVVDDLRLVTDDELDAYIQRSDAVLTAYRGFKGSSGILIRAAHFGRPVISTDEGLLGYFVRRHGLGQAIDVGDPKAFAACIETFVSTGRLSGFDPAAARHFADSSDPQLFVRNVLAIAG
jgi:glycosyltransferase involved in cell wall biosynthesis